MNSASPAMPDWSYSLGNPTAQGRIRVGLEDFGVEEIPLVHPSGEGNHLWIEIEKTGANTHWVASQLAARAGIPVRDVGYAGLKDRHGVTRQWFSVSLQEADNADWTNWEIADARLLQADLHTRKLKRGTLAGNRFRLVIRELNGDVEDLRQRVALISERGVPNYFGAQRFGHGGLNVEKALAMLPARRKLTRNKRSMYISSLRSFVFNSVLSERVSDGTWNRLLDGELAILDGTHSVFSCELPDPELERRCETFDLHPSGPLPGRGGMQPERVAREVEDAVLENLAPHRDVLESVGANADRRALRLRPEDLSLSADGASISLSFSLQPGQYATTLLRELVTCIDHSHIASP